MPPVTPSRTSFPAIGPIARYSSISSSGSSASSSPSPKPSPNSSPSPCSSPAMAEVSALYASFISSIFSSDAAAASSMLSLAMRSRLILYSYSRARLASSPVRYLSFPSIASSSASVMFFTYLLFTFTGEPSDICLARCAATSTRRNLLSMASLLYSIGSLIMSNFCPPLLYAEPVPHPGTVGVTDLAFIRNDDRPELVERVFEHVVDYQVVVLVVVPYLLDRPREPLPYLGIRVAFPAAQSRLQHLHRRRENEDEHAFHPGAANLHRALGVYVEYDVLALPQEPPYLRLRRAVEVAVYRRPLNEPVRLSHLPEPLRLDEVVVLPVRLARPGLPGGVRDGMAQGRQ